MILKYSYKNVEQSLVVNERYVLIYDFKGETRVIQSPTDIVMPLSTVLFKGHAYNDGKTISMKIIVNKCNAKVM